MTREEISKSVIEIISKRITFNYEGIDEEYTFEDLGFDSLDMLEVIMLLEEKFDINVYVDQVKEIKKVSDLVTYVSNCLILPQELNKK